MQIKTDLIGTHTAGLCGTCGEPAVKGPRFTVADTKTVPAPVTRTLVRCPSCGGKQPLENGTCSDCKAELS